MAGQKREREVERARYERQQARRQQKRHKSKQRERIIASVVVAVLAVGGFVVLGKVLRGSGSDANTADNESPASGGMDCASLNGVQPASKTYSQPPAYPLNPKATYNLTLATNCGDITFRMLAKLAPKNVSSVLGLSAQGFYDNTICHRLTTSGIYVLQCGDPKGTGAGGPGYKVADENLPEKGANNYPTGTVAMANSGPGTNGSQFFIVYRDTTLPPNYTIVGKVTEGLSLVIAVGSQGTSDGSQDGSPRQPVQILSTTIDKAKVKANG